MTKKTISKYSPITIGKGPGKKPAPYMRYSAFRIVCFFLLILLAIPSEAQLKLVPLKRSPVVQHTARKSNAAGRTQADALNLPFWDDFSFTPVNDKSDTLSNFPLDSLWERSWDTRINNGLAINPPTLNVATFDGLDSLGLPYSEEVLANGFRDVLTSQPIKLASNVDPSDRTTVFLSFFYQWQGNGEAPDPADHFRVEFKNATGAWENFMTISPKPSFDKSVFYDTIVQISDERFFHDAFQFRFRNYGRLSGPFDTWNVDYIYLNKGRSITDTSFPDQAVSQPLTTLFGRYHAMPYRHFVAQKKLMSAPQTRVTNLLDEFTDLTYLTQGLFVSYTDGVASSTFVPNLGINDTSAINEDGSGIIFPLESRPVTLEYLPDTTLFDSGADSVFVKLTTKLFTGDVVDPETGGPASDYDPNYIPIDFRLNDSISASYWLGNSYAYDDGSADFAVVLTQAGDQVAYLFEMATPEPDTLVGIELYAPDYGLPSSLTVDFYILRDNNGLPGEILYTLPSRTIRRKGMNNFQLLRMEPILVEDKFYLAWKAPVGGLLRVGLDINNDSGDKIFLNLAGSWEPNTDIAGSLMLRPRFGGGDIVTGVLPEEPEKKKFAAYPNPNAGEFYITEMDDLEILTMTGQSVPFHHEDLGDRHRISMTSSPAGLYILKVRKGTAIFTQKIVVR